MSCNILVKQPTTKLTVAEFDESIRGQYIYNYARTVKNNDYRSIDDKIEIDEWLKTMPPRPRNTSQGFQQGDAAKWLDTLKGVDHMHTLDRVLIKSKNPNLKRPAKEEYSTSRTLLTDKLLLDSLPTEEYFTTIRNSKNVGMFF
jgi:hypothetical protein